MGNLERRFQQNFRQDIVRKINSDNQTDSCYNSGTEGEEEEKNEKQEKDVHPLATSKMCTSGLRMAYNGNAQVGSMDDVDATSQGFKKIKDWMMQKYQEVFMDELGPQDRVA